MEVQRLLEELSREFGFVLYADAEARLRDHPPATVDEFTDAVLRAEGLDPVYGDKHLRRAVRSRVARMFAEGTWDPRYSVNPP